MYIHVWYIVTYVWYSYLHEWLIFVVFHSIGIKIYIHVPWMRVSMVGSVTYNLRRVLDPPPWADPRCGGLHRQRRASKHSTWKGQYLPDHETYLGFLVAKRIGGGLEGPREKGGVESSPLKAYRDMITAVVGPVCYGPVF